MAELEEAIAQAESAKQASNLGNLRQLWEKAIALYTGELLPSCYDEWIVPKREKLQQQVMQVLAELVSLLIEQADYRAGITYAQQLLRLENRVCVFFLPRLPKRFAIFIGS